MQARCKNRNNFYSCVRGRCFGQRPHPPQRFCLCHIVQPPLVSVTKCGQIYFFKMDFLIITLLDNENTNINRLSSRLSFLMVVVLVFMPVFSFSYPLVPPCRPFAAVVMTPRFSYCHIDVHVALHRCRADSFHLVPV